MKSRQFIYLFIALLLPACIFVFLKIFGKNEFEVPPLYVKEYPSIPQGCDSVTLPYHVPDSILRRITSDHGQLSLAVFYRKELSSASQDQLKRVMDRYKEELRITEFTLAADQTGREPLAQCIFFLKEPFDIVLVDRNGVIRGQYVSNDREEIDRLITEIAIILKKY